MKNKIQETYNVDFHTSTIFRKLENHLITNKLNKAGTRQKRGQYILKYEVAVEK